MVWSSQYRGFLQRSKFSTQLSQYRSRKHQYQLMLDYAQRVASDHASSVLRTFNREELVSSPESEYN